MPAVASRRRGRRTRSTKSTWCLYRRDAGAAHHLHGDGAHAHARHDRSCPRANGKKPKVAQVIVNKDGSLQLKTPDATRTVTQREVGEIPALAKRPDGHRRHHQRGQGVQYEAVVKAMDAPAKAGVQRGPFRQTRRLDTAASPGHPCTLTTNATSSLPPAAPVPARGGALPLWCMPH